MKTPFEMTYDWSFFSFIADATLSCKLINTTDALLPTLLNSVAQENKKYHRYLNDFIDK
jgi:hypothetical protein